MFEKVKSTFESAQKDLLDSVNRSFVSVASSLSVGSPDREGPTKGKTALFVSVGKRAKRVYQQNLPLNEFEPTDQDPQRDIAQEQLAQYGRLFREFRDLLDGYEILLAERSHLEQTLCGETTRTRQGAIQLESLDDLELVGQYYRALHDKSHLATDEIARLTKELQTMSSGKKLENPIEQRLDDSVDPEATAELSRTKERIAQLESTKAAHETKISYLTKQLHESQSQNAKLQRELEQQTEELAVFREQATSLRSLLEIQTREQALHETELKNVQAKTSYMADELVRLQDALQAQSELEGQLRSLILEKDKEVTLKNDQLERLLTESTKSEEVAIEFAIPDRLQRTASISGAKSPRAMHSPIRSSLQSLPESNSLRALKAECERLAMENASLKTETNLEYTRNVVLHYLQRPEQRPMLLKIISKLFHLGPDDLATVQL